MDDQNNPTGGLPDPNAGGMPPMEPNPVVPPIEPVGGVTPPPVDPGTPAPATDPNQGWTPPPPAPAVPPVVDPNAGMPAPEPVQGGGDTGTPGGTV